MSIDRIKQENIISFVFVVSFFLLFGFIGFAQTGVGINTTIPKSDFEVNGSFAKKVTVVTENTALNETHSIVVCNNATTPITLTLPVISNCVGRIYTIKKGDSTTNVTIDANSTEEIDGVETMILSDAKIAITLFNNGMEWQATANYDAQFPMGEVSYFDTGGTNIGITLRSDGSSNMVVCRPATTLLNRGEFDNGGSNNGRLRYVGKNSKIFHIACTISGTSASGSTGKTYVFGIAQNDAVKTSSKVLNRFASDADVQSTSLHVMLTLAPNDYLEFFVGNTTDAIDFKFVSLNLVAIGMPD